VASGCNFKNSRYPFCGTLEIARLLFCDGVVDQRLGRLGFCAKPVATQTRKNRKKDLHIPGYCAPWAKRDSLWLLVELCGAPLQPSRAGSPAHPGPSEKDFSSFVDQVGLAWATPRKPFQPAPFMLSRRAGNSDAQFAHAHGRVVLALVHVPAGGWTTPSRWLRVLAQSVVEWASRM